MVMTGWKGWLHLCLLGIGVTAWCGCGGRSEAPATDCNATAMKQADGSADAAPKVSVTRFAHPKETVVEFLTSLKAGDQKRATSMLTVKAQAEMARTEATIQPPGSPSAKFDVTEFEFIGDEKQGAHVLSRWTDVESDGTPSTHEIVWILRQDQSGWAVAGFATQVFADQDPLVLNFEDPLDLQKKRASVDAEIARRQEPAAPQQARLNDRDEPIRR